MIRSAPCAVYVLGVEMASYRNKALVTNSYPWFDWYLTTHVQSIKLMSLALNHIENLKENTKLNQNVKNLQRASILYEVTLLSAI